MQIQKINIEFYEELKRLINWSRTQIYKHVNTAMIKTYWEIGKMIVDEEQQGKERAEYGKFLLRELSKQLTIDFGRGFDERNLRNMRSLYQSFPKWNAVRTELTWTHLRSIISVNSIDAREFYIKESIENNWSTRQLDRQINSFYYERILSSQNKEIVLSESQENKDEFQPKDVIKNPYVLEFLDIGKTDYLEKDLEKALINKLQEFLLELGRGFTFVARQQRISTEAQKHYYIDLVFYNYLLKCFILIDLKIGTLTPQDVGQMDLYVRLYEDKIKPEDDNPTIGIILCSKQDETVVEYSVLKDSNQIFASKYQLYLPSKEEFKKLIENELENFEDKNDPK